MSKRPILSVRNLHRSYQSGPKILNVLTGADIDIYPGEMVVYQFHHLQKEFSAIDNVAIPQMIAGKSHKDAQAEANRLIGIMGLADRGHHKPSQMSGGEQQRVAIARAIANKPQVLLADEPTGNLDPATSGNVFQSLFDLTRLEGVSALVATHNMQLTQYMDRVLTVREGLIVPFSR